MKKISLMPIDRQPEIHTNERLLDALLGEQLEVMTLCGGRGLCATCHVFVEQGEASLSPQTAVEQRTLGRLSKSCANSRLACQARVLGEGVEVRLPKGMYIESLADLDSLIGKRAESDILHPLSGKTLIPAGKIILRSLIMKLKDVDFNIEAVRAKSA